MADKKVIRKDLITKRDSIESDVWNTNSNIIQKNIIRSELYRNADVILCYADFHGEVGTFIIIDDALLNGKKVFLPKVLENFTESRMEFYEVYSTMELIGGYKGIMEPVGDKLREFDKSSFEGKNILMLIPGVAFSKDGYRLGYGKGYYDYYLSDKADILKCGMCFSMQIVDSIPADENDIKMDFIIDEMTDVSVINDFYNKRGN